MIIDGHSLAFRAFYGAPVEAFRTSAGQHTNAVHGFLSMLLALLDVHKPQSLAVAFDVSRHSFRTEEYPEYKGTRGETPAEFKGQVPLIKEALAAMGICTLEKEGFEADDILATLSNTAAQLGQHVYVVSGDRDTIQLINDSVTLLYPASQGIRTLKAYDRQAVKEKYDVYPEQYPDLAALVGETSDNLPGIPKVGPKTAAKWINQYGSLAEIIAHKDEIGGKVGENLRDNIDLAVRNRKLNRLLTDVQLDVELADLKLQAIDIDKVASVFAKLEFRTLLARVKKFALAAAQPGATNTVSADSAVNSDSDKLPAEIAGSAPVKQNATYNGAHRHLNLSGLALETWLDNAQCPSVVIAQIFGEETSFAVGLDNGLETVEFTWKLGSRDFIKWRNWLVGKNPKIVWAQKTTQQQLQRYGLQIGGISGDLQLLCGIHSPEITNTVGLELIAKVAAKLEKKISDYDLLNTTPAVSVGARAALIFRCHEAIIAELADGQRRVYEEIELPLTPILLQHETRGIAIDRAVLDSHYAQLEADIQRLEMQAYEIAGRQLSLSSPKQLQTLLFTDFGLPKTRKIASGYSTDAAALEELREKTQHPFLDVLLEHREVNKLKQIVATLLESIEADGKIHTTLQQIGAATGRLASAAPNLQNIPARSVEGERIRAAFTHGADYDALFTADYSQIEMRVMAHLSEDEGLIAAFNEGEDLHRYVGARVFGVEPAEVTSHMRAKVKAMSYGLAYGLGPFGLAKQLNISQAEAKELMADYFKRFGGVRDYLQQVVADARDRGYTETIFGRRRPFADLNSPNRILRTNAERAALNAPIQGSAADIIKIAMLRIEKRLAEAKLKSRMLLQIHDELMFEALESERAELEQIVAAEMRAAAKLRVPLEVACGWGADWQQASH